MSTGQPTGARPRAYRSRAERRERAIPLAVDAEWTAVPRLDLAVAPSGRLTHRVARVRVYRTRAGAFRTEWVAPCGQSDVAPGAYGPGTRVEGFGARAEHPASELCRFGCWPGVSM